MPDDFQTRIERELEALQPPPPGDVARNALREGRRLRSRRRRGQAGVITAAALAVAGLLVAAQLGTDPPALATDLSAPSVSSTPRTGVTATPEGLLVAMLEILPPGRTSHYVGSAAQPLGVQIYLDDGSALDWSGSRSSAMSPGMEPNCRAPRRSSPTVTR